MSRCAENSQNHTLLLCFSPIPGERFEKQGKQCPIVFFAFQTFPPGLEKWNIYIFFFYFTIQAMFLSTLLTWMDKRGHIINKTARQPASPPCSCIFRARVIATQRLPQAWLTVVLYSLQMFSLQPNVILINNVERPRVVRDVLQTAL